MPIICQLCNQSFEKQINNKHLKYKHGISTTQYKSQFGCDSLSSVEYREERSYKSRGEKNPMFGKTHSDYTKQNIGNKNKGRIPPNKGKKVTDLSVLETIKQSVIKREEKYKENKNHPRKGKKLSIETKSKISNSVKKYASQNKDELVAKANQILETKKKKGYDFGSAMRGKRHSESTKILISEKSNQVGNKRRKETLEKYKEKLQSVNIEVKNYDNKTVELFCKTCSTTFTKTRQYLHESKYTTKICKICNPAPIKSTAELELLDYVKSITTSKVLSGNRTEIYPLELDIFIPNINLAIEFCGLYWHSELAGKTKSYHYNKFIACLEKGIRLITIFEDEWVLNKELVKSRIYKVLASNMNKIHARKCMVKIINNKDAREFCKTYHLQGAGSTGKALGLFYNQQLVSVMTFAKPSLSKGYKKQENKYWELTRFCSNSKLIVVGGGSKLFKKFIEVYDPSQIISYSDIRWNTGNIYKILGFEYFGRTPPSYWYFQQPNLKRTHRFALRKNNQDDKTKTEWENRQLQGWNRIWDCGNDKWIWSKK